MATLEYKSASPFMPQGSDKVTKLIVVFDGDGVELDEVIPFIGKKPGKRLTDETPGESPDAAQKAWMINRLERLLNEIKGLPEDKALFKEIV